MNDLFVFKNIKWHLIVKQASPQKKLLASFKVKLFLKSAATRRNPHLPAETRTCPQKPAETRNIPQKPAQCRSFQIIPDE